MLRQILKSLFSTPSRTSITPELSRAPLTLPPPAPAIPVIVAVCKPDPPKIEPDLALAPAKPCNKRERKPAPKKPEPKKITAKPAPKRAPKIGRTPKSVTASQVRDMRLHAKKGTPYKDIATEFGVSANIVRTLIGPKRSFKRVSKIVHVPVAMPVTLLGAKEKDGRPKFCRCGCGKSLDGYGRFVGEDDDKKWEFYSFLRGHEPTGPKAPLMKPMGTRRVKVAGVCITTEESLQLHEIAKSRGCSINQVLRFELLGEKPEGLRKPTRNKPPEDIVLQGQGPQATTAHSQATA